MAPYGKAPYKKVIITAQSFELAPKGKIPFIDYQGNLIGDVFLIIDIANNSARVTPWYTPEHSFEHGVDAAPWEGIGTGWFYSVLGGGSELRPQTNVERIPVDFDNTYDARMRGDRAVPTLFNG
ncbi:hypothetical protein QUA74_13540 [Microcoleus sp. LAD1_D3]|uniref:hypothetical protein n=1 Tax=Microcoleus sp. LAD1_D3 TaxID=2819365 RepID=UPI002FCFF380